MNPTQQVDMPIPEVPANHGYGIGLFFTLVLFIFSFSSTSNAASCCGGGASSGIILPKFNDAMIDMGFSNETYNGFWTNKGQYKDDPKGSDLLQRRINISYAHRLADQWQLSVGVPLVDNQNTYSGEQSSVQGLGDMSLSLWYEAFEKVTCVYRINGWESLKPSIYLGTSLTLPTGISPYSDRVDSSFDITGYDETVRRLNADGRGQFLGDFKPDDKILVLLNTGEYLFTGFDLSTHFDERMIHLERFDEDKPVSVVYYEGEKEEWYVKRFLPEFSKNATGFIGDHEQSRLWVASTLHHPHVRIRYNRRFKHTRDREDDVLDLRGFISVKGVKAIGNKLSALPVTEVTLEPPVAELETAHEKELQAARDADAQRAQASKAPASATDDSQQGEADPAEVNIPATEEGGAEDAQGQASLF